jgi:hypothetical protein
MMSSSSIMLIRTLRTFFSETSRVVTRAGASSPLSIQNRFYFGMRHCAPEASNKSQFLLFIATRRIFIHSHLSETIGSTFVARRAGR